MSALRLQSDCTLHTILEDRAGLGGREQAASSRQPVALPAWLEDGSFSFGLGGAETTATSWRWFPHWGFAHVTFIHNTEKYLKLNLLFKSRQSPPERFLFIR